MDAHPEIAMAVPLVAEKFDFDAYLAWEATQEGRYEYLAGEVFAMSGGSDAHNTIAGNVFASLRAFLRAAARSLLS